MPAHFATSHTLRAGFALVLRDCHLLGRLLLLVLVLPGLLTLETLEPDTSCVMLLFGTSQLFFSSPRWRINFIVVPHEQTSFDTSATCMLR